MNKLLLLAILFQKTDIATIIVLIGVVVLILVAAIVSTISNNQDEKEKDDRLKENSEKIGSSNNIDVNFINYSDVNTFNENEYYIELNIGIDSAHNFSEINEGQYIDRGMGNGVSSFGIPASINGTQRLINIFTYGVPDNIQDDSNNYTLEKKEVLNKEKRSRRISQEVKDKVWNRDGGKCVDCGSNENLEFDHIIPHSKGGANTYRNIQLLCEPCNRSKSAKIG